MIEFSPIAFLYTFRTKRSSIGPLFYQRRLKELHRQRCTYFFLKNINDSEPVSSFSFMLIFFP